MRTFSICIYAQLFPAHVPLGNSCQYPILLPHSFPRPPNSFSFSEEFCPRPSQQSCCLSYCNIPTIFSSFTPYRVLCHHLHHAAVKRLESPLKVKNDVETKMWWRDFYGVLPPWCREPYYVVTPSFLPWALCCFQSLFLDSPSKTLREAQLHSRIWPWHWGTVILLRLIWAEETNTVSYVKPKAKVNWMSAQLTELWRCPTMHRGTNIHSETEDQDTQ